MKPDDSNLILILNIMEIKSVQTQIEKTKQNKTKLLAKRGTGKLQPHPPIFFSQKLRFLYHKKCILM